MGQRPEGGALRVLQGGCRIPLLGSEGFVLVATRLIVRTLPYRNDMNTSEVVVWHLFCRDSQQEWSPFPIHLTMFDNRPSNPKSQHLGG